jgi:hydrogenase-4 component B
VPAVAIVPARRDAPVRSAVFAYLGDHASGRRGRVDRAPALAQHGAIGDPAALTGAGGGTQTLVAVAALVGFGRKAGLVPLHSWLPRAHPVGPPHLSALM